jgi:hypothetical protein
MPYDPYYDDYSQNTSAFQQFCDDEHDIMDSLWPDNVDEPRTYNLK